MQVRSLKLLISYLKLLTCFILNTHPDLYPELADFHFLENRASATRAVKITPSAPSSEWKLHFFL